MSTVSNPYTFNITKNKKFSGNCVITDEKYTINASYYYNENDPEDPWYIWV